MPDPYQRGPDDEWLKHSNDELARMLKRRDWRIRWLRFLNLLLGLLLVWVLFKYSQKAPIEELWNFTGAAGRP